MCRSLNSPFYHSFAKMETLDAGNVSCDGLTDEPVNLEAVPADENDSCYAILVQ